LQKITYSPGSEKESKQKQEAKVFLHKTQKGNLVFFTKKRVDMSNKGEKRKKFDIYCHFLDLKKAMDPNNSVFKEEERMTPLSFAAPV
jgi:hypothetical protein